MFVLMILGIAIGADSPVAQKRLTILFTHDLHSSFQPRHALTGSGQEIMEGGLARLAYALDSQRSAAGPACMVVDAGDFSMGTPFHTIIVKHAAELRLLGLLGYDFTTFGNHDFDFRTYNLASELRCAMASGDPLPGIVASNMYFSDDNPADSSLRNACSEYGMREWMVIERGGIRIGLFGLMGHDAAEDAQWAYPITFPDPVANARRVVSVLKNEQHADLVVCLSHCGTWPDRDRSEDELLAAAVPDIDVIISGHTHTVLPKPIQAGSTVIVSAGCFSAFLGRLVVSRTDNGRWKVDAYDLQHITQELPESPRIAELITGFDHIVNDEYFSLFGTNSNEVLASSRWTLHPEGNDPGHALESSLGDLITDAYREAVKRYEGSRYEYVHCAVAATGLIRDLMFRGHVTSSDVFSQLSLGLGNDNLPGYPLIAAWIRGSDLKHLLEIQTTVALVKRDANLQVSGIRFTYNPHRIWFDRVVKAEVQNSDSSWAPIDHLGLYRICMSSFFAKMMSLLQDRTHGLLPITLRDRNGDAIDDLSRFIVQCRIDSCHTSQVKEWNALAKYLRSFPDTDADGIPDIPGRYAKPDGRITVLASWNPYYLIRGSTWITWSAIGIILIIATGLFYLVRWITKRLKNRHAAMSHQ
jgi:2',3'-cyclic-nucleotide 2'-phosphodiesterase (5'-nucleotidase family)